MAAEFDKTIEGTTPVVQQNGFNTNKASNFGAAVTMETTLDVTGTPTFATAPLGPKVWNVTNNALVGATVVLTEAQSGRVFVNRSTSGTPSFTLPTLAAGLTYTFICGNTTAGFTVTGASPIQAKTSATGTAITTTTTLTNTQGTAVVGDAITITGDATSNTWRMVSQTGIFAAS